MRIISGKLKGRVIKTPGGNKTHPMSEKIRGAIFNALGDIEGLTLLDAFSGSGAIAIEAYSHGADYIVAIDNSKEANRVITQNIKDLSADKIKNILANNSSWSDNNPFLQFDIVVSDPPYNKVNISLLKKLEVHVKQNGLYVISLPPDIIYSTDLKLLKSKNYNDAKLYFYKKI